MSRDKFRDLHCFRNTFVTTALETSSLIPETMKLYILQYPEKCQMAYDTFVTERFITSLIQSIWDT